MLMRHLGISWFNAIVIAAILLGVSQVNGQGVAFPTTNQNTGASADQLLNQNTTNNDLSSQTGGNSTNNGQSNQQQFGTGEITPADDQFLNDSRRTSINENNQQGAGGGQNGAANNPFLALFGGNGGGQGAFGQGGFGQGAFGNGGNRQNNQRIVRSPLVVDFETSATTQLSTAELAQRVTGSFARQPRFRNDLIIASAIGETLVLTGTIDSQRKKESAARIARMEPGVRNVDNRLTVSGQ